MMERGLQMEDFGVRRSDTMVYCLANGVSRLFGSSTTRKADIDFWKSIEKRVASRIKGRKMVAQDVLREAARMFPTIGVLLFELTYPKQDVKFIATFNPEARKNFWIIFDREERRYKLMI